MLDVEDVGYLIDTLTKFRTELTAAAVDDSATRT